MNKCFVFYVFVIYVVDKFICLCRFVVKCNKCVLCFFMGVVYFNKGIGR